MNITTKTVSSIDHRVNSFGQLTRNYDSAVETTVTGTLDELIKHSFEREIILRRTEETEHLFRSWDHDSKFVILYKGTAFGFAYRLSELGDDVAIALRYYIGNVESN